MVDVFKIVLILETFEIFVGKALAKLAVKPIITVKVNLGTLKGSPNSQPFAVGLAYAGQQGAQGNELGKQVVVVYTIEGNPFHANGKTQITVFVVNDIIGDVLADFRQKIRLSRLLF